MIRGSRILSLTVILATTIASAEPGAPPLPIPAAPDVAYIALTRGTSETVVRDPEVIAQFVAFLGARNTDWHRPWDTFPTPEWTIRLVGRRDDQLVLWLGPNWLGGREGQAAAKDNRLRSLSQKEHDEVLNMLGAARR
jgi:hypothetical protein